MSAIAGIVLALAIIRERERARERRRRRRYRVYSLLAEREGQFWTLYSDIRTHPEKFFHHIRMSIESFDHLLELCTPELHRLDTASRKKVSPTERLVVTLWFLATGHSYACIHFEFHLGKSTIYYIVQSTCKALWRILHNLVMPVPTQERWKEIADLYWERWNFPNCVGAMDGKRIRIVMPPFSGSNDTDYKKYFSLVLLAVVDANYRFTYIDVGSYGNASDSAIFNQFKLGQLLHNNQLKLPADRPWPGTSEPAYPFFFVTDECFAIDQHVIQPYSQRELNHDKKIFNCRFKRARRTVECTFGVLSNKWRILHKTMQMTPENATNVIKATCVLHNYVCKREGYDFDDSLHHCFEQAQWSNARENTSAITIRDDMANYFLSPAGGVAWQEKFA
ncbi:uncharacterized protein ACMZJ9_016663 isoform 2-T2 [Mantella aurantiaca]